MLYTLEASEKVTLEEWKLNALEAFKHKMLDTNHLFPCIPATQGYKMNQFHYGFASDPRTAESSVELAEILKNYSKIYKESGNYTSLIVFFNTPEDLTATTSVDEYETIFWKQLSRTSELDPEQWPKNIPTDPHDSLWEFCFCAEKYFMFCGTPAHTNRQSRYFPYLMLAITPRSVLETFHQKHAYAKKIKASIRNRLMKYDQTAIHPNLNAYGNDDNFEWKQYFLHDDQTSLSKCPFHKFINKFKK